MLIQIVIVYNSSFCLLIVWVEIQLEKSSSMEGILDRPLQRWESVELRRKAMAQLD